MMIVKIYILFILSAGFVFAQTKTTSAEKVSIYSGCLPKCVQMQAANPENDIFKDLPFVVETYCSCHCSRVALRISKKSLLQAGRAAVMGEETTSIPEVVRISKRNQEVCLSVLMD